MFWNSFHNSTLKLTPLVLDTCIIGAAHVGHCPVQPYIPIYLIVLGATSLLSLSVTYTKSVWGDGIVFILSSICMSFLHLFSFGWFIAGGRKIPRDVMFMARSIFRLYIIA